MPSIDKPKKPRIRIYFNRYIHNDKPMLEWIGGRNSINYNRIIGAMHGKTMFDVDGVTLWSAYYIYHPRELCGIELDKPAPPQLRTPDKPVPPQSLRIREGELYPVGDPRNDNFITRFLRKYFK